MIFAPRSRVYILVIPVFFFLLVTYPYFRSFAKSRDDYDYISSPYRRPHRPSPPYSAHPPPSDAHSFDAPPIHPPSDDPAAVHHIPVLDKQINSEIFHGESGTPLASNHDAYTTPAYMAYDGYVIPSGLAPTPTSTDGAPKLLHPSSTVSQGNSLSPEAPKPSHTPETYQSPSRTEAAPHANPPGTRQFPVPFGNHPIDDLIQIALERFENVKKKESHNLTEAAGRYREKRGRHPPPGFDKWYEYAKEKGAVMIEDLFDTIYEDTEPFWGRQPATLRQETNTWSNVITIRNGEATVHNSKGGEKWVDVWADMLQDIATFLPDMDLACNTYDEPRIVVPWEQINQYMKEARKHKNLRAPDKLVTQYQVLPELSKEDLPGNLEHEWEDWHERTPYWNLARRACHPDSVARGADLDTSFELPPQFPEYFAEESHQGYVANYTFSKNACLNPYLRNVHGNFVKPRFVSINTTLFPMFGGSKHEGINNEIRIPAAKYWSSGKWFGGKSEEAAEDIDGPNGEQDFESTIPWTEKTDTVFWRGSASGGAHDKTNWRRFQRHRFISMLNSTEVSMTERKLVTMSSHTGEDLLNTPPLLPHNFPIPNTRIYPLTALSTNPTHLGEWLKPMTDVAFTHMMCSPQAMTMLSKGGKCKYTDDFYHATPKIDLAEAYNHKYLPDIDGNGYSGRYRAFLRSGSLPIKATVHAEWHDSRIMPWLHFVPMDNTFVDLYSILEYFAGNPDAGDDGGLGNIFNEWLGWASGGHDGGGNQGHRVKASGHDAMAEALAEHGREWTQKVLRKEDMVVYMYRLLLEWARLTNDKRNDMGWAEDLR